MVGPQDLLIRHHRGRSLGFWSPVASSEPPSAKRWHQNDASPLSTSPHSSSEDAGRLPACRRRTSVAPITAGERAPISTGGPRKRTRHCVASPLWFFLLRTHRVSFVAPSSLLLLPCSLSDSAAFAASRNSLFFEPCHRPCGISPAMCHRAGEPGRLPPLPLFSRLSTLCCSCCCCCCCDPKETGQG